jgi:predicted nuclease of predicted toxin-antitoxin system
VRFLLDEDLNPAIAEAARALDLEVVSVHDLGRRGLTDHEQLVLAATEERTFVTRNRDDFIRLTIDFFRAGRPHSGLLIVPHTPSNRTPGRLARVLQTWSSQWSATTSPAPYFIDFLSR